MAIIVTSHSLPTVLLDPVRGIDRLDEELK
jgi:hypothetical protein